MTVCNKADKMQSEKKDSSTQTLIHPSCMLSYTYWAACFDKSQLSQECDELEHVIHSPVCTEEDCLEPYTQQSLDATSDDGVELSLISKTVCSNSSCRSCSNSDTLHFDFIKDLDCSNKRDINFRSSFQDNAQHQRRDVGPPSSLRRIKSRLKKSFSHDVGDCSSSSFQYVADSAFDKDALDECDCLLCESRRGKGYASSFGRNQENSFDRLPSDSFMSLRSLNESAEDLPLGEISSSNTRQHYVDNNAELSDISSASDVLQGDISGDTFPTHEFSQFPVTTSVGKRSLSTSCKVREIPQHRALSRRNSEPNHLNAQRNRRGDAVETYDSSEEKVIRAENRCSRILYELEALKSGNTELLFHDRTSEQQMTQSVDNLEFGENIKSTFADRTAAGEESKSLGVNAAAIRTLSHNLPSHSVGNLSLEQTRLQNKMTIELFALENYNEHRYGFLGKAVPFTSMLSWTKDCIGKPMIRTSSRAVKRTAPEVFRLVQMYMGDRKSKLQQMQIALLIIQKNLMTEDLRDETYAQLCRQTTNNPQEGSLMHGWVLMGICLSAFFPSFRFQACLTGYICQHMSSSENNGFICHFATYCGRLLERASKRNVKGTLPKINVEYVERSLKSIFRPSHFGSSLEDLMQVQKYRYPDRTLPWIQTTLSEKMLCLNCPQVEGIFRVPGDKDEVGALQATCDQWILPESCSDPHVLASLLKQWYRDLYEPLIPSEFYDECIRCTEGEAAVAIVQRMPTPNQLVLSYLIRFLQVFAAVENSSISKMDAGNLATVMAPNCLHCESDEVEVILKNAPNESNFIKTLILYLDTSFMDGIC